MVVGIILLAPVAIVMIYFFVILRKEKAARKEQEKELDEYIYDPISGVKMTMEQAEKGHFINSNSPFRVKLDEEIEKYYGKDEKEIEYIKRYFAQAEIAESKNEDLTKRIFESQVVKQFKTFNILHLWEIRPTQYFALIHISNDYLSGRHYERVFETQMLLCIKNLMTTVWPKQLKNWELERIHDWQIFRLPKKASYQDFIELVNKIGS